MKNQKFTRFRAFVILLLGSLWAGFAYSQPRIQASEILTNSDTTYTTICSNQLPFMWNGISCLTAGFYSANLPDENGNIIHEVLYLLVNNVGSSITNAAVCDNQLPYYWNGNSYLNSGTYSVTLNSANGCDSVPILSLTINHVTGSTTYRSVCNSELPYIWNGHSYNNSGIYNLTLTSSAGCDSIASLNLYVRPVSTSLTTIEVCSNRLPFNWNGNSYNTAGTYVTHLTGANGCDSSATLNLLVNPVATSFTQMSVCSNQFPFQWNNRTINTAGNYTSTLTASTGCDSLATLIVSIKAIPASTTNLRICNASLPYTWNNITCNSTGAYTAHLVSSSGCDSVATLNLVAQPVITTSVNQTVCISDLPILWNNQSFNAAGSYPVHFVSQAGCDSIVTLNLTVLTPTLSPLAITICEDQLPYTWHGYTFTEAGTYTIDPPVQSQACNAINAIQLTVRHNIPSTTYKQICAVQLPYQWNGQSFTTSGTYTVLIHRTTGCDSTATLILTVSDRVNGFDTARFCSASLPFYWNGMFLEEAGDYAINLTSHAGCDSVSNLHLMVDSSYIKDISISVCESQLPFSWNGQPLNTSGNYQANLHAASGCDSIVRLYFTTGPYVMVEQSIQICNNQLPYAWRGMVLNQAGIYRDTIPGSITCDSIIRLTLEVNDEISSVSNVRVCENELPYQWNGHFYNQQGNFAKHFTSAAGCDSVALLNLTILQPSISHTFLSLCNNQLPYNWNGHAYPSSGVYAVSLTSVDGCDSTAVLHLSVTNILTSTTNVTLCPAQLPYSWNGQTYSSPGTYSITINNPNGCDSVPILSLTVAPQAITNTNISICASELPFSWNGNEYATAGNYSVHLTGSGGCDSLANLTLTVREIHSSYTELSLCSSELPLAWNGLLLNATGNYEAALVSLNECDSIAHLALTVKPTSTSNTTVHICAASLPYQWNGNDYGVSGTYSTRLENTSGCDSIAVLHLVVGNSSYSETQVDLCANGLPFLWQGRNIQNAGTYRDTLISSTGCDSILVLHLSVKQPVASNQTVSICSNQLPYAWCSLQINAAGDYSTLYIAANGCDSTVSLHLQVNFPTESNTEVAVCSNQLPYLWNGQSYNSSGNYAVTLNNAAGCDSVARLNLTVKDTSSSFVQITICSNQLPYSWNGSQLTEDGIYTSLLNNQGGCDSIAYLQLFVKQTPSAPQVVSPVVYCQQTTPVALTAIGENQLWFDGINAAGQTISPTPSTQTVGVHIWFVSQNIDGCSSVKVPVIVRVNAAPLLGDDKQVKYCYDDFINLDHLVQTNYNHNWYFENQLLINPEHVETPGLYNMIAITNEGCSDSVNITISRQPEIIANAGPDATIETGFPYQLQGSGGLTYEWSPAIMLDNYRISNPKAIVHSDTWFVLTVKDDAGCVAQDSVFLRVLDGPGFYVPTAFTPNSDGMNDIFRPFGVGIERLDYFRVFNRYGQLMFETHEINKGWDGTFKGVKQSAGNYVWMLQAVDRKGKLRVMKGSALLIR